MATAVARESFGALEYAIWVMMLAIAIAGFVFRVHRRVWRLTPDDNSQYASRLRRFWGATPTGRGFIRAAPVNSAAFLTLTAGSGGVLLSGRLHNDALLAIGGLLFISAFPVGLLQVPIILFNRPKLLVPPGLRDQPGMLAERRAARAIARAVRAPVASRQRDSRAEPPSGNQS